LIFVGGEESAPGKLILNGGYAMEIDRWIESYKVRALPWIDGKRIYFNVQYFAPGQAITKAPVWDKTVYITDNDAGRRLVYDFTHTAVDHIAKVKIADNTQVTLNVLKCPELFNLNNKLKSK